MYKSLDAGKSWHSSGLRIPGRSVRCWSIRGIQTSCMWRRLGHQYGPNPERGVFRSNDGGKTWEKSSI